MYSHSRNIVLATCINVAHRKSISFANLESVTNYYFTFFLPVAHLLYYKTILTCCNFLLWKILNQSCLCLPKDLILRSKCHFHLCSNLHTGLTNHFVKNIWKNMFGWYFSLFKYTVKLSIWYSFVQICNVP